MASSKPLIVFHSNCPDGFTAAWVAARALGDVELFEGRYGDEPPYELARGRPVYVVDFSYPRDQLQLLKGAARTIRVLDHHKTAEANLRGLPYCTFDMERSGATLTWDHFHPGRPRPWVVAYVEDRDLWRFDLPDSEMVSLWIRCTPHTLDAWDAIARLDLAEVLEQARGCRRYLDHYVADALRKAYPVELIWADLGEPAWQCERVFAVNVSYTGVSDVLHGALVRNPDARVALGWHVAEDGKLNCSFRSVEGFDCSRIARSYGGGGHAQASGFRMAIDHPQALRIMRTEVTS